jgi:hypothetical protein
MPRCPLCGHGLADTQDTRMDSRIRVSTNPPDRQMPVSAALEDNPFPNPCLSVLIRGSFTPVLLSQSAPICVSSRHNMASSFRFALYSLFLASFDWRVSQYLNHVRELQCPSQNRTCRFPTSGSSTELIFRQWRIRLCGSER